MEPEALARKEFALCKYATVLRVVNVKPSVHRTMMGTNVEALLVDVVGLFACLACLCVRAYSVCVCVSVSCLFLCRCLCVYDSSPAPAPASASASCMCMCACTFACTTRFYIGTGTRRTTLGAVVQQEPYVSVMSCEPNKIPDSSPPGRSVLDNVVDKVPSFHARFSTLLSLPLPNYSPFVEPQKYWHLTRPRAGGGL